MEIKKWLNEELVAAEEITGRQDLQPFLVGIKNTLVKKSFDAAQASSIVGDFLKQLNASGYLAKIEKDDAAVKDIQVSVEGSNVSFTVTSDYDIRDKKMITIKGIAQNLGAEKTASKTAGTAPQQFKGAALNGTATTSIERNRNVAAKAIR